jgi:phosphoglycolate phosphatase
MAVRAIIFDLDGTIWDTLPWYSRILGENGTLKAEDCVRALEGGQSIVRLIEDSGCTRSRFVAAATYSIGDLRVYPGIRKTLRELARREMPLAVFTSLPGSIADPILSATGLNGYFRSVKHAGNAPRKPNPKGIYEAVLELKLSSCEGVVYVGDRDIDARTATRAGIDFVWASYGYQAKPPETISHRINHPHELLDL